MENLELNLEKNKLEELQEIIANSKREIENEFSKTANSWLSCVGSQVFVIEIYLNSRRVKEIISTEEYNAASSRVEDLKKRLIELKKQYPEKNNIPPDKIKLELLGKLDIFNQSIYT